MKKKRTIKIWCKGQKRKTYYFLRNSSRLKHQEIFTSFSSAVGAGNDFSNLSLDKALTFLQITAYQVEQRSSRIKTAAAVDSRLMSYCQEWIWLDFLMQANN